MSTTAAAGARKPHTVQELYAGPDQIRADVEAWRVEADARKKGLDALIGYNVNDVSVFDTSPTDLMRSTAEEAHALCTVLSASMNELIDVKTDELCLRPAHIATAVSAIGTLISLSLFASEGRSLEK